MTVNWVGLALFVMYDVVAFAVAFRMTRGWATPGATGTTHVIERNVRIIASLVAATCVNVAIS